MRIRSERRPWGFFTTVMSLGRVTVKYIVVDPNQSLSLQYHSNRDEFWVWTDGVQPRITVGDLTFWMEAETVYTIPRGVQHRIENPHGSGTLTILEVAKGRFDEEDIVRIQDNYGRV